ncbi:MAG: DUF1028 domain-containing protein [Ignavibacteriae bacterium]|nr:MAG: DUF1028 domain-containing protein [Ignavibacteriota bacterium]
MKIIIISLLSFIYMNTYSQQVFDKNSPLVHTYSIVARDTVTGEIGVAVQSHWFNVGSVVGWGEAGVGVIATQSFVNPAFGIQGLEMLKKGKSPQQVVDELIVSDEGRDMRQLAVMDAKGNSASYTGKGCIDAAGNIAENNVSVQANMMVNAEVWPAMLKAFKETSGPLAERMISALEAAQETGGDIRGKQSASIMIFTGVNSGKPWADKLMDLRVEDNAEPVKELKRLVKVYRAYEHMNNGDLAVEKGNMELAMKEYSAAEEMFPDNAEMKYWHAVTLANKGNVDEALPLFKAVFEMDNNWRILTERLPKVNLLTVSNNDYKKIIEVK